MTDLQAALFFPFIPVLGYLLIELLLESPDVTTMVVGA